MTIRPAPRRPWLLLLLVASCAAKEYPASSDAERWRTWFDRREFGEDPYFFFPRGDSGPTGCPENQRLSYAGADSIGIRLLVIEERGAAPTVRANCSARFDELRGDPAVRTLPDGRAMWALRAARPD